MNETDTPSSREPFEELAEGFVERYRRGEHPSISEYVERHPDLADRIRRLFPTLVAIEQVAVPDDPQIVSDTCGTLPIERLGDYRIVAELGRGGMGVVYEAEQQSLGRRVALKVLMAPTLIDGGRRERFLREARAAARLHHTNIVPVYGIGEENGICYYVMQLIPGRGLDEVLDELRRLRRDAPAKSHEPNDSSLMRAVGSDISSTLSDQTYWNSVARVGLQVAEALVYAHSQGIIHRDIKPSNLLLDIQGNIWVADFGLAKATEDSDLTHSGDVLGTLRYMAPERFRGQADVRSDLYSLGLSLYELVSLEPAFGATDRGALMQQVAQGDPPRPRRRNRDVPPDLETVILKCIAKNPADRYAHAEELAADLRCVLENRPIRARRVLAHERLWRWCRRNPAVAALTGSVALLLCVLATFGTITSWKLSGQNETILAGLRRARSAEREAVSQADRARQAETSQRELRLMADRQLFQSYLAQARAQFGSRRPGQRTQAITALTAAAHVADSITASPDDRQRLRDEAAAALSQFDITPAETWPDDLPPTSQMRVAFSADLEQFARAELGNKIVVRNMRDGRVLRDIPLEGALQDDRPMLRWSSDGDYLLARGAAVDGSDHAVCVWSLAAQDEATLVARVSVGGSRYDQAVDLAPDSQSFVCLAAGGRVTRSATSNGKLLESWSYEDVPDGLRFSPDGTQLLSWTGGDVAIRTLDQGQPGFRIMLPARLDCAAWRRDGRMLACGGEDGHIYLIDLVHGVVQRECVGHQSEVREVAFHPQVDLLASSSWDGTVRLWDLRNGKEVLRAIGAVGPFSNNGRWLGIVADQTVARWEVSDIPWAMALDEGRETIRHVQFSHDGRLLFVGSLHNAGVWDAVSGRRLASIPGAVAACEHPTRDAWITAGAAGILTWPRRQEAGTLHIGPPEVVVPIACDSLRVDAAAQRWLATSGSNLFFWDSMPQAGIPQRWHQDRLRFADLSADGRWIASSGWNSPNIHIWASGQADPVAELAAPRGGWIAFSPDGRYLGVSLLDRYEFYRVGTWDRSQNSLAGHRNLARWPGHPITAASHWSRNRGSCRSSTLRPDGHD